MYRTHFQVSGEGSFPFDMLRYDGCFPESGEDVNLLLERGQREVGLIQYHLSRGPQVTTRRWESFGWSVGNLETRKV